MNKTFAMRTVELLHNKPLEELLNSTLSLRQLGKQLGVSYTTVLNWRRQLGIDSIGVNNTAA